MHPQLLRAGEWFLRSGIQQSNGGVSRYYRTDLERPHAVSTEITGYTVSTLVFLHQATGDERYLDRALAAARFLTRTAWNPAIRAIPFETGPAALAYFFDGGMVVRGLLAAWRASSCAEFLDVAAALGRALLEDFPAPEGDFHPVLELPSKRPAPRDAERWSRNPGCYQLKAALGWAELAKATGDAAFGQAYERAVKTALRDAAAFLPGDRDRAKVMDRLHAFLYFLEGLAVCSVAPPAAAALGAGIGRVAGLLREIAPGFARSDVYAQLLRIRLWADWHGVAPLDLEGASAEAAALAGFQASSTDRRIDGGFYFGRTTAGWLPYVNPVSTAFALQALEWWECRNQGACPLI